MLLAALVAAGSLLINQPALAQLADETYTFSGEVASTCSINGLNSNYAFSFNGENLESGYQAFQVNANSRVALRVKYEIVNEVPGNTLEEVVLMRQVVGGDGSSNVYATVVNTESSALSLSDTPGTATAEVMMVVGSNPPPGDYAYQVTISCYQ